MDIDSEAHTVAGWVIELFGSIPKSGGVSETEELTVTVLEAEELRVNKVKLELKEKLDEDG